MLNPQKILTKAELWRRRTHHLSLSLRLKSLPEAKKFLKEQVVALWNGKAEIPNLLDATMGRIARGKERNQGKAVENCFLWRQQILASSEFLECKLFCKLPTVIYEDLWPSLTVISNINKEKLESGSLISREAKKIFKYLQDEGTVSIGNLRKSLRMTDARSFRRFRSELENLMLIVSRKEDGKNPSQEELLSLFETVVSRQVRIPEKDAKLKILSVVLQSSVVSQESRIKRWFSWDGELRELIEDLLRRKDFLRIQHRGEPYIVSSRILK